MKVKIEDLKIQLFEYLKLCGLNDKDAKTWQDLVVDQEIVGNQFSAIGHAGNKKSSFQEYAKTYEKETVEVEKPALKLYKGNGRPAPLITADHLDEAVYKSKTQGIYAMGIYDSTYNDFFDVFCRRIVAQDCVAVIVENGGPQGVVPFGGKSEITGTNPIAYGIPTNTYPIVFDAATAMHAYGRIRQAKERGEVLPENAYVDKQGNITTDPKLAHAVLPFGGFKGWALNLLIDVLSGALVKGRSGLEMPTESERYIGTLIIIIDPAAFGNLGDFKSSTTKLVEDILAVSPQDPQKPVKVPGRRGSQRIEETMKSGMVEIEDDQWGIFSQALAEMTKPN